MLALHDSEAGVTELSTRESIVSAVRGGWRPSTEGFTTSGPLEAIPLAKHSDKQHNGLTIGFGVCGDRDVAEPAMHEIIRVGHKRRKRLHLVALAST